MTDKCGTPHGYKVHQNRNEPPCKFCLRSVTAPTPTPSTPVRKVAKCGTPSGANRHRNRGEPICPDCRQAKKRTEAARIAAKRAGQPAPSHRRDAAVCGTTGGYDKHLRDKTKPCDSCRLESNKARRERKQRQRLRDQRED